MPTVPKGNPRLAVAYLRVSTDTDRQALGAEVQRSSIRQWAEAAGVEVAQWFVEEVSGGRPLDKRPVLLEAIATVATLGAGRLVVQKLDRFSRDPLTAALAECELRKNGASLVCADGTASGDDPTSELIRGILLTVARFEKALIRSRIKAALAVKRTRGERVGAPPYGYRADGKSLILDGDETAIKDRLRAMRAQGLTIRQVLAQATREGLRNRMGRPFTVGAVHNLVKDCATKEAA
jgi:DNA invertase Pin-like site-specific DNA recombinase